MSRCGQAWRTNIPACVNVCGGVGGLCLTVALAAVYSTLFLVLRFHSGIEDWFEACLGDL